ncbi:uncharacterized protein TNIN_202741 [Trichonephila inaurata madagascariensis]|uniref:Uncharacterized protein n=1 Tax=Trichonephila inaurata madagascariensis TaxID=2747483 RepID=A0A8X7CMU8_9ARAC|nr:uncharacterized protein TNIN_202741 [Trichonephila inaurata madagascariensis]
MSNTCIAYRNNMTELEEPRKDILYYFAFILSIANTFIYGLLKKPSSISSPAEDENDEPNPKRRVTTCIPCQAAHNNEARHMPEMVGDRNHRCKRKEKCSALTTVQCTDCKVFLCFTSTRETSKTFHENKKKIMLM